MQIIIKLKEVRKKYNISIRQLANKTGISESHLRYIENGEREPGISILIRIAVALNIDEKELYEVRKWIVELILRWELKRQYKNPE